ncbi:hypothetical protein K438DRAFT_1971094 [Mycena galopus ATCC 62051]|nr:hypothetical protein K438DRAFT_1971094 [Mycena galopus ATCC 62051]
MPSKTNDPRTLFDDESPNAVVATPIGEFTPDGHSTPFTSPSHGAANTKAPGSTDSYRVVSDFADQPDFFIDRVLDGDDPSLLLQLLSFRDDGEMAEGDTDMSTLLSGMDNNEEDELHSSPTAPIESLRLPPLPPQLQPKQPLALNPSNPFLVQYAAPGGLVDYPSSDEEDEDAQAGQPQVGGGYPRREATPQKDPPAVRLRSHLRLTDKASPTAFNAVQRRARTVPQSSTSTGSAPDAERASLGAGVPDVERESLGAGVAAREDKGEDATTGLQPCPVPRPAWTKGQPAAVPAPAPDNAGPAPAPDNAGPAPARAPAPAPLGTRTRTRSRTAPATPVPARPPAAAHENATGASSSRHVHFAEIPPPEPENFHGSFEDFAQRSGFQPLMLPPPPADYPPPDPPADDDGQPTTLSQPSMDGTALCSSPCFKLLRGHGLPRRDHRRLDADFAVDDDDDVPRLTHVELKAAYELFKEAYTQEFDEILETAVQLVKHEEESGQSLRQRQNTFTQDKKQFTTMANKMREQHHFEFFGVIIGAHVNEDSELGGVIATEGLASLLDDLSSCEDDFLAAAKLTAYRSLRLRPRLNRTSVTSAWRSASQTAFQTRSPGLTTKAKAKERNSAHQLAIKTQRVRIGEACFEDVNVNLVFKANENFMCLKTAQNLRDSGVRMVGFPAGVRPFPLLPTGKATGAWRHSEVDEVALALDARKIPGQGLRFERLTAPYQLGDFVIFSHDYRVPAPTGGSNSPASIAHWRTSKNAALPCTDGEGQSFLIDYDIRPASKRPVISVGAAVNADTSKGFALQPAKPTGASRTRSRSKKSQMSDKAKGKRKAEDSEEDDYDVQDDEDPEEEEPMSPPPTKRRRLSQTPESEEHSTRSPSPSPANWPVTRAQAKDKGRATSRVCMSPPLPPPPMAPPVQEGGGSRKARESVKPIVNISDLSDDDDRPLASAGVKRRTTAQPAPDAKRTRVNMSVSPQQVLDYVAVPPSPRSKQHQEQQQAQQQHRQQQQQKSCAPSAPEHQQQRQHRRALPAARPASTSPTPDPAANRAKKPEQKRRAPVPAARPASTSPTPDPAANRAQKPEQKRRVPAAPARPASVLPTPDPAVHHSRFIFKDVYDKNGDPFGSAYRNESGTVDIEYRDRDHAPVASSSRRRPSEPPIATLSAGGSSHVVGGGSSRSTRGATHNAPPAQSTSRSIGATPAPAPAPVAPPTQLMQLIGSMSTEQVQQMMAALLAQQQLNEQQG